MGPLRTFYRTRNLNEIGSAAGRKGDLFGLWCPGVKSVGSVPEVPNFDTSTLRAWVHQLGPFVSIALDRLANATNEMASKERNSLKRPVEPNGPTGQHTGKRRK